MLGEEAVIKPVVCFNRQYHHFFPILLLYPTSTIVCARRSFIGSVVSCMVDFEQD
jgi:hypothetical protein